MKLNITSQYAIRILSFMAINNGKYHNASSLSQELNIPYKYLTKIMTILTKASIVNSIRGRNGGFVFVNELKDIRVSDILDITSDNDSTGCILGQGKCNENDKCVLHNQWKKPKHLIATQFNATTLEDISLLDMQEYKI